MFKTIFDSNGQPRFTGFANIKSFYAAFPDAAPEELLNEKMYRKYKDGGIVICACDTETTGLDPIEDYVVQFAGIKYLYKDGEFKETDSVNIFIRVPKEIPEEVSKLNHITNEFLATQPDEKTQFGVIKAFLSDADVFMAYNEPFDFEMLESLYERNDDEFKPSVRFDIMQMVVDLITMYQCRKRKLGAVAEYLGIPGEEEGEFHDALFDIRQSIKIFETLRPYYEKLKPDLETEKMRVPRIVRHWVYQNEKVDKMQRVYYETDCGRLFYERWDRALFVDKNNTMYAMNELNMEGFIKEICRYHRVSRLGDLTFLASLFPKK